MLATYIMGVCLVIGVVRAIDSSGARLNLPSLNGGIDGKYIVPQTLGLDGQPLQISIHGKEFEGSFPGDLSVSGTVEKIHDTLRFIEGPTYQNGYLSPNQNSDPSRVDLAKLLNDGQTIEFKGSGGQLLDFVKQ